MTHFRRMRVSTFEAIGTMVSRPRLLLAGALASGLGIGLLVAISMIGTTAQRSVSASFDVLRATTVELTPATNVNDLTQWMPSDYDDLLSQIGGVVASNRVVEFGESVVAVSLLDYESSVRVQVIGVDAAAGDPFGTVLRGARLPQKSLGNTRYALIGERAAMTLGISDVDGRRSVFIGERPFVVSGIVRSVDRSPRLLDSVIVDAAEAAALFGEPRDVAVVVQAAPGAASSIGDRAPLAIRPDDPSAVVAATPPDPGEFRGAIEGQLSDAVLMIGVFALLFATAGIGFAMLSAVRTRIREIGLRRAIGATPSDVFLQFLVESLVIGFAGGLTGVSIGVIGGVVASRVLDSNPILEPGVVLTGVLLGVLAGTVSGIAPAIYASRIPPAAALRGAD